MSDDPWAILAYYAAREPIRVEYRPGMVQRWRATVHVEFGGRLADGRPNIWTFDGLGVTLDDALRDLTHFLPWPPPARDGAVDGAQD